MKLYSSCHAAEVKVTTKDEGVEVRTTFTCKQCDKTPEKVYDSKAQAEKHKP